MKVSKGPSAVQKFLSQNISKLRPTTSLILSSAQSPNNSSISSTSNTKKDRPFEQFENNISQQCKAVQFYTSMQFNLKTVQFGDNTLTSSFPTLEHIAQTKHFMNRTMGTTDDVNSHPIISVGNGAAMDLAKACYSSINNSNSDNNNNNTDSQMLVLVPTTLGSALASTSSNSLILDLQEEALITPSYNNIIDNNNVHVLIDTKAISIPSWINHKKHNRNNTLSRSKVPTIVDSSLASIAIALDSLIAIQTIKIGNCHEEQQQYQQQKQLILQTMNHAISCLKQTIDATNDSNNDTTTTTDNHEFITASIKNDALQTVLSAGQLLSFGNHNNTSQIQIPRNMTLALSSALLPKYFPHGNWLTFVATLLPGIIQTLDSYPMDIHVDNNSDMSMNREIESALRWTKEVILPSEGSANNTIIIPSLSSLADGTPNINELSQKVDDNGALLQCQDLDSDLLENVLVTSLNR